MSYILKWEEIKYDHEQEMLPKRVRLLVYKPNPRNSTHNVLDLISEPLANTAALWEITDDLQQMYPGLTWKDTGLISLVEQIEAELM